MRSERQNFYNKVIRPGYKLHGHFVKGHEYIIGVAYNGTHVTYAVFDTTTRLQVALWSGDVGLFQAVFVREWLEKKYKITKAVKSMEEARMAIGIKTLTPSANSPLARMCMKRPKKVCVYYSKSDFKTPDEYLDAMARPPISDKEALDVDWDAEWAGK